MSFIALFGFKKKQRTVCFGDFASSIASFACLYKYIIEEVANRKNLSFEQATNYVNECMAETLETLKK